MTVVRVHEKFDGALWHVTLDRPKANIIDREMTCELIDVFARARDSSDLKAICLTGAGDHFSFGASVQEHAPDQVREMLSTFHLLFRRIAESTVMTLAAVRGQCLGGGLELVAFCNRVFVTSDACLGQPEIRLGVFAPVASVLLPERMRRGAAEDLCMTGRSLSGEAARLEGLADELAEDPVLAAEQYFETHLAPHSATSLRHAHRAIRRQFYERFFEALESIETLYLNELMATADAREGIAAFLEKRSASWRNR